MGRLNGVLRISHSALIHATWFTKGHGELVPADTAGFNGFDEHCQESEDVCPTLEAMAMRQAIVITDTPGCRAKVQDGRNDFLVPVRDSRALADAVARLAADPTLIARFGGEGRRIAEEKRDMCCVTAGLLAYMVLPPAASARRTRRLPHRGSSHG